MLRVDFKILHTKLSKFMSRSDPLKVLFIRNAESSGNLSGTLNGWMNTELTEYGRKQAFAINEVLADYEDKFDKIHTSDLQRSCDTANYALGFPSETSIAQNKLLRECNFGTMEGIHYDSMSDAQKQEISSPDYVYPQGESFNDVRKRGLLFMKQLTLGNHLIFTHGGVICSLLQDFDVTQMPEN